jgi:hypothetical protein
MAIGSCNLWLRGTWFCGYDLSLRGFIAMKNREIG